jgi:hypothetical protein
LEDPYFCFHLSSELILLHSNRVQKA